MAFVVVYDACVLYPAPLRDLLIRIALTGIVRARWSDEILDECFRSISKSRPDLKPHALSRTRRLMTEAVADCIVTGHESLINGLNLPDPNDRHVLAAAIQAGAQSIVTLNLKDFPSDTLAAYNVEAVHPDEFIYDLLDLRPSAVVSAVREQVAALRNPPATAREVLDALRANGLVQSVAKLEELIGGEE